MKTKLKGFIICLLLSLPVIFGVAGSPPCKWHHPSEFTSHSGLQCEIMHLQCNISCFVFLTVLSGMFMMLKRTGVFRYGAHINLRLFASISFGASSMFLFWAVYGGTIMARLILGVKPFVVSSLRNGGRSTELPVEMARDFLFCVNLLGDWVCVALGGMLILALTWFTYKFFRKDFYKR